MIGYRKSDLPVEIKRLFFQAEYILVLLYICTPRTLTKRLEKKLDLNYTGMIRAILNKSYKQNHLNST